MYFLVLHDAKYVVLTDGPALDFFIEPVCSKSNVGVDHMVLLSNEMKACCNLPLIPDILIGVNFNHHWFAYNSVIPEYPLIHGLNVCELSDSILVDRRLSYSQSTEVCLGFFSNADAFIPKKREKKAIA